LYIFFSFKQKKNKNEQQFLLYFFLLNFIFFYAIYFVHPASLDEMLPNTLDRLLFQISSVGIIFMGRWINKIEN